MSVVNAAEAQADIQLLLSPCEPPRLDSIYTQLDASKKEIRLLKIWRPYGRGRIHAKLLVASLTHPVAYEALSYCWGAPSTSKVLVVDEEEVQLRRSLYSFLSALISRGQHLPIWLDVLCINQKDTEERNQQVSMMSEIYRGAQRVLSWIGEPNFDSEYALSFAQYGSHPAIVNSEQYSATSGRARQSWLQLISRPYWRRVWIVQEICLARELFLLCGGRTIEWSDFINITRDLLNLPDHMYGDDYQSDGSSLHEFNVSDRFAIQNVFHLESTRIAQRDGFNTLRKTIAQIVVDFEGFLCSEQKDHVYGFVSLASRLFPVDYRKSFADIFFDVIRHSSLASNQDVSSDIPNCHDVASAENPIDFMVLKTLGERLIPALGLSDINAPLMKSLDSKESPWLRLRLSDYHRFYRRISLLRNNTPNPRLARDRSFEQSRPQSDSVCFRFWPLSPGPTPEHGDFLFMVEENYWRNPIFVIRQEMNIVWCIGFVVLHHAYDAIRDMVLFRHAIKSGEMRICDTITFDAGLEEVVLSVHISRICLLAALGHRDNFERSIAEHREMHPVQNLCPVTATPDQLNQSITTFSQNMAQYKTSWTPIPRRSHLYEQEDPRLIQMRANWIKDSNVKDSLWHCRYIREQTAN